MTRFSGHLFIDEELSASTPHIGGKAASLATLTQHGLPVPRWLVIPAFPLNELNMDRSSLSIETILLALKKTDFPARLHKAVQSLFQKNKSLAVRSSALEEDGKNSSYAGLFESFLNVPHEQVLKFVIQVWLSGFQAHLSAYQQEKKESKKEDPSSKADWVPAVIIQEMVHAELAGIGFGCDPITGQDQVSIISAVFGLGSALVSGETNGDSYYLDPQNQLFKATIQEQSIAHQYKADGGIKVRLLTKAEGEKNSLASHQAEIIASLIQQCGQLFGSHQDIEWAIKNNGLYLLQSRPITTKNTTQTPINHPILTQWSKDEIIENWRGHTLPLTASFANHLLQNMYYQSFKFNALSKISDEKLYAHCAQLTSLIQGQLFFNQSKIGAIWFQCPSLEFTFHKLRIQLTDPQQSRYEAFQVKQWCKNGFKFMAKSFGILTTIYGIHSKLKRFFKDSESIIRKTEPKPDSSLRDLIGAYDEILNFIEQHWEAPSQNNALSYMLNQWLSKKELKPVIYSEKEQSISQKLSGKMNQIVQVLQKSEESLKQLQTAIQQKSMTPIFSGPKELKEAIQSYLDEFGQRCLDDHKLESPSLIEDPYPFFESLITQSQYSKIEQTKEKESREIKSTNLSFFDKWLSKLAGQRFYERERSRFQVTKLFQHLRQIFLEIGKKLAEKKILESPEHIFYLYDEEIRELLLKIKTSHPIKELQEQTSKTVQERKQAYEHYKKAPLLPHKVETYGLMTFQETKTAITKETKQVQGIGCSSGWTEGELYIVDGPIDSDACQGKILVAQSGDPGHVTYFPLIKGLIYENGNLLSHTSIVARELGVPAVCGISGVKAWLKELKNNEQIQLDGESGWVKKI